MKPSPLQEFAQLACPTYYAVEFKDCKPDDLVCFDPELGDPRKHRIGSGWLRTWISALIDDLAARLNDGQLDHAEFYWIEAREHRYVPPWAMGLKVSPKPNLKRA